METKTKIAVVGMSCLFPGAKNINAFWSNIINKVNTSEPVPNDRWIINPDFVYDKDNPPDKARSIKACLINDFIFDPNGYEISSDFLSKLDILYHFVLHTGKEAFHSCKTNNINKKNIGVILAAIALPTDSSSYITRKLFGNIYKEKLGLLHNNENPSFSIEECLSSRVTSLPASILAKALGLGGGSYTLDAACASSLYAIKLACDELIAHRTDMMLAGGVNRAECLYTQIGFSQLKALSPSGKCSAFDKNADGLVVGEGAGIIVLKRLEDALRDKDSILCVIEGIGLSNDMGGNVLAPATEGQLRAMKSAYEKVGWNPNEIDIIECHGAGTPVGDEIELSSIKALWRDSDWKDGQCAIGSVKSMIGHLLTGAGIAGFIKTVLAIMHKTLPPSLNFSEPKNNSPLIDSPFRVQTEPFKWERRNANSPLKAAVSAFGFGGINAHVLIQEWQQERKNTYLPASYMAQNNAPIAIIGMDAHFGELKSLYEFKTSILKGESSISKMPENRWKGSDKYILDILGMKNLFGCFMEDIKTLAGEFHIPPSEILDMLPEQLLMLKVSSEAMKNAGILLDRKKRPDMGVTIGMNFDFEATNFHLRWYFHHFFEEWEKSFGTKFEINNKNAWLEELRNSWNPPLTSSRTVGSLGAITASRIAKEFLFGGPSFIVSCDEASGIKALEIALRSLQNNETYTFLVGSIDLCCDPRNIVTSHKIKPYSDDVKVCPLDESSKGRLPGEGACGVVLKKLDNAIKDGDRIYAVIKGIGSSNGGWYDDNSALKDAYKLSMERAFKDASVEPSSISYFEAHGSGDAIEDTIELNAITDFFRDKSHQIRGLSDAGGIALGTVKANIGHTGASSGLASIVKTALCLYQEIIPPIRNYSSSRNNILKDSPFHVPILPQYWLRNRIDGQRRACVAALTTDGCISHVILEGVDTQSSSKKIIQERKRPLGLKESGLFAVYGDTKNEVIENLEVLKSHIQNPEFSKEGFLIEKAAKLWYGKSKQASRSNYGLAIVAGNTKEVLHWINEAKKAVENDIPQKINGPSGIRYSPSPLGKDARIAFVFPGSGNHYIGMGRGIGVNFPDVLRKMDAETNQLASQMIPWRYMPWRSSWKNNWEGQEYEKIESNILTMIFGQVVHGGFVANLIKNFKINPNAVIGYSLGESAGLFATGAWPERGSMQERMENSPLFFTELVGSCTSARKAWKIPDNIDITWKVAVVNRASEAVNEVIKNFTHAFLLIVNTPDECVIGGLQNEVEDVIKILKCEAVYLYGVITVHCNAAEPSKRAYKLLHVFPTNPPSNITYYSCQKGDSYELTSENAASSILAQALYGFDFSKTIKKAYDDGIRIFLEMGPHSSCTRMIGRTLGDLRHISVSACTRGEDDYLTLLKFLSALISERVLFDLNYLYGQDAYPPALEEKKDITDDRKSIVLTIGGKSPIIPKPVIQEKMLCSEEGEKILKSQLISPAPIIMPHSNEMKKNDINEEHSSEEKISTLDEEFIYYPEDPSNIDLEEKFDLFLDMIKPMENNLVLFSKIHRQFLDFSKNLTNSYGEVFKFATDIGSLILSEEKIAEYEYSNEEIIELVPEIIEPLFPRQMCMEFAIGSIKKVLGSEFAEIDNYPVRVRLPDEPLMLVDRILSVEGEKLSLSSGRIVTEHDVYENAWYLDGGRVPVCISIEAGQADLFLCSYLGIDLAVKGKRSYRLLDAVATFHSRLPKAGDIIRYEIEIHKFIKQGETYLFFFSFNGFIKNAHVISMRNGCAGFFTDEDIKKSGGIILTPEEQMPKKGIKPSDWKELVPFYTESYNENSVKAIREGNLEKAFGSLFHGVTLSESLRLPSGRMELIHRILKLDPNGGRYSLGIIQAEADIHADDWFLTCHFVDDMVMPGTLMYQCCEHTLRVFILRMGWVTDKKDVCYEPVPNTPAVLKCRGPVTIKTKKVVYELEIKELGYNPEPYVIADAYMYGDGKMIVMFREMSLKISGIQKNEIDEFWKNRITGETLEKPTLFDTKKLLAYAIGNPSEGFGEKYKMFDKERIIARLPGPPYFFMDRVTHVEPEQWVVKAGGWIEAEYKIPKNEWYFKANKLSIMPFCVLLEIALQPCGWLAAYVGSALRSNEDLKFRNLGGNAILYREIIDDETLLTMRCRLTKVSEAGNIIIEEFDMEVLDDKGMIYKGDTTFGFFTKNALSKQVGVRDAAKFIYKPSDDEIKKGINHIFTDEAPLHPYDDNFTKPLAASMPSKALRMIDKIELFVKNGGHCGLGFIRASKKVDPSEWFFKAHFYQDPVCPGSLGIESFIQLIKFMVLERWPNLKESHRFAFALKPHNWIYRGQILPSNKNIEVEAWATEIIESPNPFIFASGVLKVDGLCIYKMENFGIGFIAC
ncbi:MAG: type I polyketide synthase [Desulfobacterales bacterium]|nr:type I polyketide synthase [Desulfobacterales bacterium]